VKRGYPVTVNDPAFVDFARSVATELLGPRITSTGRRDHGAEDFSYVLQRMPGCLMFPGRHAEAVASTTMSRRAIPTT